MHDVAVRARRKSAVNDDLVAVQVEPFTLLERIALARRRQLIGRRVDGLLAVVTHRAPTRDLLLEPGRIVTVGEAGSRIRSADGEIAERMRRQEWPVYTR